VKPNLEYPHFTLSCSILVALYGIVNIKTASLKKKKNKKKKKKKKCMAIKKTILI
jgi:hypothetical protein